MKGAGTFQNLAPFMLYCFQFSGEWFVKSGSYFSLKLSVPQRKEKDREDIASQLGRQKYVLILRQLNQSQCPHFTAQPLLRTLKYTLADEEGTLHSWRKAFIEMNLHFGRNSLIIAMLIGLISTWYGHNVALRVRSISSFSMVPANPRP